MVKLQGRWFEPFLVKFPLVKIEKGAVTDEEVQKRMENIFGGFLGVIREREGIKEPEFEEKEVFRAFRGGGKKEEKGLSELEILLLKDVGRHRLSSTSERYGRLGLNAYQGNKAKDSLIEKGLIEVKDVPTGTGRIKLLFPTEKGLEFLRSLGINTNQSWRRGGVEHEYWRKRLADYFREKGYRVIEEKPIGGGKAVDLVAENEKERIAVEIETGKSDPFHNLTKDLSEGFDRVVVVEVRRRKENNICN